MEHCRFCQANLEPGAQRCSQCGQVQSTSLTATPLQPAAPTPLLSLAAHSQDTLPDTPVVATWNIRSEKTTLKTI
jgi:hypothetical protein